MEATTVVHRAVPHSVPTVGDEEATAVAEVVRSGQLAQGREVEAFEKECAAYVGRKYGVATSSGTAALHLALAAVDAHEVALPSYACAALLTAVHLQGAGAKLCDIGPDFLIDCESIPESSDTVIVPHLFGGRAALPSRPNTIEDIAQSFGGTTGKETLLSVTSFYATKLVTTGEGGMVFTDDHSLHHFLREYRTYDKRDDSRARFNYKMTDFQAAMGRVQLRRLPRFLAQRRAIAERYMKTLTDLPIGLPSQVDPVYFRFVIRTDRRAALERHLRNRGIDAKRPVHRPAHLLRGAEGSGQFKSSDQAHLQALSLPIYPSMLDADQQFVIESLHRFFD